MEMSIFRLGAGLFRLLLWAFWVSAGLQDSGLFGGYCLGALGSGRIGGLSSGAAGGRAL